MGIMDKIFDKDDDKEKERKKADFSDVSASSASAAPAARADFSDVQSSSSTTAPRTYEREKTYTVVSGDTLSKIAKREYGDATKWQAIYQANRDKIKNPDLIYPGQVLTLPPNA